MAQPYSDDLRLKLLDAYEAGVGSLRKLAAQFCVSWGVYEEDPGPADTYWPEETVGSTA
jgi:hypothetical protein